jgi:adenosylhomocysteine nucleosidase
MLGILCGLESEEKIARRIPDTIVACSSARPLRAKELARNLADSGATRLLSFGIAGSLSSSFQLGDVVIGTQVRSSNGAWLCDEAWGQALSGKIPQAKFGKIYGSDALVSSSTAKALIHQKTGCAMVDMESHCIAEAAAEANLPLMVIRSVCDDSSMNVPKFLLAAVDTEGSFDLYKALRHIALHPLESPDFFRVMCGTRIALDSLKTIRQFIA